MASATLSVPRQTAARRVQTRFVLAVAGAAALLLTLFAISQALAVYSSAYAQFSKVVEQSSVKVQAAEQALAAVAAMDTNAADFIATAPDNPEHWKAFSAVRTSYRDFRTQLFAVRSNLNPDSPEENDNYQKADQFSFEQFWQHIGNLLTAQQNGDRQTAINEYITADNYLQNQIVGYLQNLERLNFDDMVRVQQNAATVINGQAVFLGVIVIALAIGLTILSFWLRQKVRRVLTPGIDAAMVLGWLLALLMLLELGQAPGQLKTMVQDAYYSVSAASRVLAVANQANSMESGSVIDPANASTPGGWQENFDKYKATLELRMCGQPNCLSRSFTSSSVDAVDSGVIAAAQQISPTNKIAINGIAPLVANVTFSGEAQALENARIAYTQYLASDAKLRELIKAGNLDDAVILATGSASSQRNSAFGQFITAMTQERDINLKVFNDTWHEAQSSLQSHRLLYGLVGYGLLIVLLVVGVYHRFREL